MRKIKKQMKKIKKIKKETKKMNSLRFSFKKLLRSKIVQRKR